MQMVDRAECPFCWKVRIALAELGLTAQKVLWEKGWPAPPLLDFSPQRTTPVFMDGDIVLWESSIILDYLDERYGPHVLLGAEPELRARARTLQHYSDRIVGPSLREVVFEKREKPEAKWDMARIEQGLSGWRRCMAQLEMWLGDAAYFVGDFSVAECALLPRFGLAETYGAGVDPSFPALFAWFRANKERPSYLRSQPRAASMPFA